jgi:hypothetical protein
MRRAKLDNFNLNKKVILTILLFCFSNAMANSALSLLRQLNPELYEAMFPSPPAEKKQFPALKPYPYLQTIIPLTLMELDKENTAGVLSTIKNQSEKILSIDPNNAWTIKDQPSVKDLLKIHAYSEFKQTSDENQEIMAGYTGSFSDSSVSENKKKLCIKNDIADTLQRIHDQFLYPLDRQMRHFPVAYQPTIYEQNKGINTTCFSDISLTLNKLAQIPKMQELVNEVKFSSLFSLMIYDANYNPTSIEDKQVCLCTLKNAIDLIESIQKQYLKSSFSRFLDTIFKEKDGNNRLRIEAAVANIQNKVNYNKKDPYEISSVLQLYRTQISIINELIHRHLNQIIANAVYTVNLDHPTTIDNQKLDPYTFLTKEYLFNTAEQTPAVYFLHMMLKNKRINAGLLQNSKPPFIIDLTKNHSVLFRVILLFHEYVTLPIIFSGKQYVPHQLNYDMTSYIKYKKKKTSLASLQKTKTTIFHISKLKQISIRLMPIAFLYNIMNDRFIMKHKPDFTPKTIIDHSVTLKRKEDISRLKLNLLVDVLDLLKKRRELFYKLVILSSSTQLSKAENSEHAKNLAKITSSIMSLYRNLSTTKSAIGQTDTSKGSVLDTQSQKMQQNKTTPSEALDQGEEGVNKDEGSSISDNEDKQSKYMSKTDD